MRAWRGDRRAKGTYGASARQMDGYKSIGHDLPVRPIAWTSVPADFAARGLKSTLRSPIRGRQPKEDMWQLGVHDVALVAEADLLHHPPRGQIRRQREARQIGQLKHVERDAHALGRQLRRQALAPELRHQRIADLNLH